MIRYWDNEQRKWIPWGVSCALLSIVGCAAPKHVHPFISMRLSNLKEKVEQLESDINLLKSRTGNGSLECSETAEGIYVCKIDDYEGDE